MIYIKSAVEIEKMRAAGALGARVMEKILSAVRVGITTAQLDKIAKEEIASANAVPSFLGYRVSDSIPPFPGAICTSVNDEVVHGIPGSRSLKEGDIISIDLGVMLHGYHSDMARTVGVGKISKEAQRLIDVTKECFFCGIEYARAGLRIGELAAAIQQHAESNGMGVVRELTGHGIGQSLHESPEVLNFATRHKGISLRAGMTIAVEPMINLGTERVFWDENGWTVKTADGSLSAHYENTIAIGDGACEILTLT